MRLMHKRLLNDPMIPKFDFQNKTSPMLDILT